MAKVALNKSALAQQNRQLKIYRRFLPALDLKRRQLIAERNKTRRAVAELNAKINARETRIGETLPMLANESVDLTGLVRVTDVQLEQENVLGAQLPKLGRIEMETADYGFLTTPHWVDNVAMELRIVLEWRVRLQIEQRRLALLEQALQKITQRVNLFDKVLIPRTQEQIKRIQIYLADAERAAVVRAKIAKRKRVEVG